MHFDRERVPLLIVIIVIAVGALVTTSGVSLADKVSVSSAVTILPMAQCTMDIGGSYLIQGQTQSAEAFTSDNVIVTAHFGGTYRPAHLQTMSITVKDRMTTFIMDNVWWAITDTADLGLMPQLSMDYTEQLTLVAYGFTIGMKSVVTMDHVDLAAETADFHTACSETVGVEFGYPRSPRYPGEILSGLNILAGGTVSYPGLAPHAQLTIAAHSSTGDIRVNTNWKSGESSPYTTITAALRMGAIMLTGDTTLSFAPYRVTAGTMRAALRLNGLSLALAGTWPSTTIKLTIGYQYAF